MRKRLAVVFVLIVVLPVALLLGAVWRMARYERQAVEERFREALDGRLLEIDRQAVAFLERETRVLGPLLDDVVTTSGALRELARRSPRMRQTFLLAPDGALLYPAPGGALDESEFELLDRGRSVLDGGALRFLSAEEAAPGPPAQNAPLSAAPTVQQAQAPPPRKGGPQQMFQRQSAQTQQNFPGQSAVNPLNAAAPGQRGWTAWFWGRDIEIAFWVVRADGRIAGAQIERSYLLARLIAQLPDTAAEPEGGETPSRFRLVDALDHVLYQWGSYEPPQGAEPAVARSLSAPLAAWRLECFMPPEALQGPGARSLGLGLLGAAAFVAAAVFLLAAWFFRAHAREMREAAQRVSFVNQVSHELKTPLTNIRMYAEMLEDALPEDDAPSRRRVAVVVEESRRLARLIGNILSFSRAERRALKLRPRPGDVDEVVARVLDVFRPALEARGVRIRFEAGAGGPVRFDPDAVEQILNNLVGNVEKYAAEGGRLDVATARDGRFVRIAVADAGPGVPRAQRERIFEPFVRLSDRVTDGVAGTGIGLGIARDLARLHGGDLVLKDAAAGATFEATFAVEALEEGDPAP